MAKKNKTPDFGYLNDQLGDKAGFEDLTMDSMAIPFIRLLQSNSPQLKKSKAEYIPEAEEGMFCNTVNSNLYEAPLRIVVGKFERYFIEWGSGLGDFKAAIAPELFQTNYLPMLVRDEKNKLVDPKTGNTFADTYIYYVVLLDHLEDGVCIISMTSTGLKEAKKLNRNLTHTMIPGTDQRALPYFIIWSANVVEMSNDKGDWLGLKFNFEELVTQEQLEHVVEERKAIPQKTTDLSLLPAPEDSGSSDNVKY